VRDIDGLVGFANRYDKVIVDDFTCLRGAVPSTHLSVPCWRSRSRPAPANL
jgi:hypothetical protein